MSIFVGAIGYTTKINQRGDSEGNFTLLALRNENSVWGLYPVGVFRQTFDEMPVSSLRYYVSFPVSHMRIQQPFPTNLINYLYGFAISEFYKWKYYMTNLANDF